MATDSQIKKQVEKNESLRRKIAEMTLTREEAERQSLNDIQLRQLKAEEAQLQQELEYAKRLEAARKASAKNIPTSSDDDEAVGAATGTNISEPVDRLATDVQSVAPDNGQAAASKTATSGKAK